MKYKYINNQKYIDFNGRLFISCEESNDAVVQMKWAYDALKSPNIVFPNGVVLHEKANEVIEECEDVILKYLVVTA